MELPLDLAESISVNIPGLGAEGPFRPWSFTGGSLRRGMSGVVSCCVLLKGGLGYERACLVRVFNLTPLSFFEAYVKRKLYNLTFF